MKKLLSDVNNLNFGIKNVIQSQKILANRIKREENKK